MKKIFLEMIIIFATALLVLPTLFNFIMKNQIGFSPIRFLIVIVGLFLLNFIIVLRLEN